MNTYSLRLSASFTPISGGRATVNLRPALDAAATTPTTPVAVASPPGSIVRGQALPPAASGKPLACQLLPDGGPAGGRDNPANDDLAIPTFLRRVREPRVNA
jgi:hypothetical protein